MENIYCHDVMTGQRENERDRQTDRHRQTHRDRHTDRQTHRQNARWGRGETVRDSDRGRNQERDGEHILS